MRRALRLGLALAVLAGAAAAQDTPPPPRPFPDTVPALTVPAGKPLAFEPATSAAAGSATALAPGAFVVPPQAPRGERPVEAVSALALSPRPPARPENLRREAVLAVAATRIAPLHPGRTGSVCGDSTIRGERLQPIPGRVSGCGVAEPVRITAVAGLRLSQPAILDCTTARTLSAWVATGVKPAVGRLGGGPAGLRVAAHYACRTRNNQKGAKISEHGRGHAIDISGIRLANGAVITVLKGWNDPQLGRVFHALHKAACGRFGTVLGPGSDGFHRDHLHFDTARYRSGSYCR